MARYIGIDAHTTSCTIAVVGPSGRKLGSHVVETNGQALVEQIRAITRPRHVCLEEGVVAENPSERESRCLPHIPVVQAANLGKLDHPAQLGSLDDPRLRRVAVQRQVTA